MKISEIDVSVFTPFGTPSAFRRQFPPFKAEATPGVTYY